MTFAVSVTALPEHNFILLHGSADVDEPLIAAAAESEREIALCFLIASVHQNVHLPEQLPHRIVRMLHQLLIGIAGIAEYVFALVMRPPGQLNQRLRLTERLSAGKRETAVQ